MLVRITAGIGVGQIVNLVPAVAMARIAGGTAEEVKEQKIETAALKRNEREQPTEKRVQVKRRA